MRKAIAIAAVLLMVLTVIPIGVSEADGSGSVLIDYGNGRIEWTERAGGSTYIDVLTGCKAGSVTTDPVTVDGMGPTKVTGKVTVETEWRGYSWNGGWEPASDLTQPAPDGNIAFGLYPEGFGPVSTPEHRGVWTQIGGNSASDGVSQSYGQKDPKLPVEWFTTYSTGFIDSCIVAADDLLYHTTGGMLGASGDDANPHLYAVNRFTGKVVWQFSNSIGAGYEVTTPLIVDDKLVVSFTNGDLIVFDRYTGDVLDRLNFPFEPPLDAEGDIDWDGRTFITGATSPTYDSGAVFFGLSDGRICSYALSPEGKLSEIWTHAPPVGERGCLYFHAPVISEVDGKRMLFTGGYEGYVYALDTADGSPLWSTRVIDMRDSNPLAPNTPGSAATVAKVHGQPVILVACTDGSMIPETGYTLFLDARTGEIMLNPDGSQKKIDCMMTKPVTVDEGFYTFITPRHGTSEPLLMQDGSPADIRSAVYKFDWDGRVVWISQEYPLFDGQLTLADGVIYGMDYSAGSFWPNGGGATAVSAEDGSELWRLHLRPCTETSYSMVSITVLDGKLYTANDMGALYCISDVAGPGTEEEWIDGLVTVGFKHWSWAVLIIIAVATVLITYRLY